MAACGTSDRACDLSRRSSLKSMDSSWATKSAKNVLVYEFYYQSLVLVGIASAHLDM